MDMEKVIRYVNTNRGNGRKQNLNRMRTLLKHLGNPHQGLPYIHITGTNGKGSTSALFYSVLRAADFNVGVFTSPHLEKINERIRFNDEMIQDEEFIRILAEMEPVILELEEKMGEYFYAFELLTTAAFIYFQEKQPDVILLEAGIGGRLDSTNVIEESLLSIITSIGLDHMNMLGETIEEILADKAEILKDQGQLIVGPIADELKPIPLEKADAVDGTVTFIERDNIKVQETNLAKQIFDYKDWSGVEISMLGKHQIENACLVLEAVETLKAKDFFISKEAIFQGLKEAYWPGRFEKMLDEPLLYIDGAHNVASVGRLVETLEETFPNDAFHFVVGMMKDKDYETMFDQVKHLAKEFILISPDPYRGFDADEVAEALRKEGYRAIVKEQAEDVVVYIKEEVPKNETVIQFGSLYLVGDMERLLHRKS